MFDVQLSMRFWGIFFILVGFCIGLVMWLLLLDKKSMKQLILGLAKLGPCTGLELAKAGYAKRGTVYISLRVAVERGLVRERKLPLTDEQLVARGGLPKSEFRLTTKGWSLASMYASDE